MKRLLCLAGLLVWAAASQPVHSETGHQHESAQEEATDMKTIRGEVIDITCAIRHDAEGPDHEKCAIYCANLGCLSGCSRTAPARST